jgi:hypothetical protein
MRARDRRAHARMLQAQGLNPNRLYSHPIPEYEAYPLDDGHPIFFQGANEKA